MNSLIYVSYFSSMERVDNTLSYNIKEYEIGNEVKTTYTSEDYLIRFITTLRKYGKYEGEIIVLFYGGMISPILEDVITENNVEIISPLKYRLNLQNFRDCYTTTVNNRYIDIIPILKEREYDWVANFDLDCWFVEPITNLPSLLGDGCLYAMSGQIEQYCLNDKNHNKRELEYYDKVQKIIKKYPRMYGSVMAGFMAGKLYPFLLKCEIYKYQVDNFHYPWVYGIDQFFITENFNLSLDGIAQEYNIVIDDAKQYDLNFQEDGLYYSDLKVVCIHKGELLYKALFDKDRTTPAAQFFEKTADKNIQLKYERMRNEN